MSPAEVLLIAKVLVRGDQDLKGRFGSLQQLAVVECGPPHFEGGEDCMPCQRPA
jgi:hypothetical protein